MGAVAKYATAPLIFLYEILDLYVMIFYIVKDGVIMKKQLYLENAIDIKEIERSLQKTYRIDLFAKMLKALDEYQLIQEGDKIAVGISGGKDSLLLAKMLQQLQRFSKVRFTVEYIAMDPGFREEDRKRLEETCKYLNIPVKIFDTNIFDVVSEIAKDSPCYLCARMRRGNLYAKARELGCNKLALGHHYNDVIETIMMNILWTGSFRTMMPKIKSQNFEGLELIRPLYLVEEKDIIRWINYIGVTPMDESCPIVEKKNDSQRANIKEMIQILKKNNPNVEKSIFKSAENIFLGAIIGYIKDGERHSFLDEYDK